jgi:hypothetical protein
MNTVQAEVAHWLNTVVIGLNLCPFAAKPASEARVRFQLSAAQDEEVLLQELHDEIRLLDKTSTSEIETTLLIVPQLLGDFCDYTQFLSWADKSLKREGWRGVYQLASFHPHYCFAGAEPEDAENLTNRSPYPILHIIREASLSRALEFFPDVDQVPERNRLRVAGLTAEDKRHLFHYLFTEND